MDLIITGFLGFLGIAGLVIFFMAASALKLWFQSVVSGASISLVRIVMMPWRQIRPALIVNNYIFAKKAGLSITVEDLETHFLAQGHVTRVVQSLVAASKANIQLGFNQATAIDLAGRDILDAINTSVYPKVIDVPMRGGDKVSIDAVAKDGIQLRARARVTVRTYLPRLIGGATEETVVARVGEGIVSAIGSADSHKDVLENPDIISKFVLNKQLDAGTAFEILSIDIADVDVGTNIGAKLQADQAEADKRVAQARAEERRAMAVAMEQEQKAKVQENRAKVILAEAEVPLAMAEAFRKGNMGIMDYVKYKNVESDTMMRQSIADSTGTPKKTDLQ
ncbi:flotillin-like protein FloA [Acanthopleuribacter pedis]|uniref:Flotillin-like protein FloA n=1 Tax=Acanthopleuribacter pedis TaxID=442870 RepID=A0A8J7Q409_9BACT|nr:flotillin-like protein FloA [Acanthopleuribacter pedis]MBO1318840.1 flotillin-like protein FloA [Acanthopleuribacter pedis]